MGRCNGRRKKRANALSLKAPVVIPARARESDDSGETDLGAHAERANNPLSFDEAYAQVRANPNHTYRTTGNQTVFLVTATSGKKGRHAGERVLRFMSDSKERARAYQCCWGHRTNCNSTHIDIYTKAVRPG